MKIPQMIAAEFRRLTSTPMAIVALIALMCVPVLYGGLYLWANQDPYAKLNQIPAAIVVDDRGATTDGKQVNLADEVANELVKDGSFDWHRVSRSSAASGVNSSKYDFSLTFPADFSESLLSVSGDTPHQAKVTLTTNDVNSYLASTIGTQAAEKVRTSIVRKVNQQAADRLLVALATVRDGMVKAADGTDQLLDGATKAKDGSAALAAGTGQLATGSAALRDGLTTMQQQTAALPAQTERLAQGAGQVAAGNDKLAGIADEAGRLSQDAANAVPTARAQILAELQQRGVDQATIDTVMAHLDTLGQKVVDGNGQVQGAVGQVDALAAGSEQVSAGARQLADATPQLTQGIGTAQAGASALATGAAQAQTGAAALDSGLGTLKDGLGTLDDSLKNGVKQIPESTEKLRAEQAKTIADPVDLGTSKVTSAGTYGAGLAPFFVALAAWIGIYALFLIVKPVSRRAITALHSPLKVTAAGWLTPGVLGAIQMIGLFAVVSGWLGFNVDNPLGTYALMALASFTFAAIILALNVWLGSVGQFLGLVLMVLQLVTAGGTFPWQTLPAPLAALHHVLPMSFAVDGMRQLMYGGSVGAAWADAGVLAAWLAAALALAAIGVTRMTHFRTLRDLRPSLIG